MAYKHFSYANAANLPIVTGPYCADCVAAPTGVVRLGAVGTGTSGIMIVGDSPWEEEVREKENFAGNSGYYLNKQLERVGLSREEVSIVNVMACKPPHLGWIDNPERFPDAFRAIKQCSPYLDEAIAQYKPKCLVTLDNVPLRRITQLDGIEAFHAYVHSTNYGIPAVATFHPSYIIQGNHKLTYPFLLTLLRAKQIVEGTLQYNTYDLLLDPSPEEMRGYIARAGAHIKYLMIDIETAHSASLGEVEATTDNTSITRFSISVEMGKSGLSVPWAHPYIAILQEAIDKADWLLFYNQNFDMPRLRAFGIRLIDHTIDVMNLWHWFQSDLPKALAFSAPFYYKGGPWKHLSHSQPDFYSAMDAAVQGTVFNGAWADVEKEGRLERFMRHCVKVSPILVRMGQAGVSIDIERRQQFFQEIDKEVAARDVVIQAAVPDVVKPIKEWKRAPKDMTGVQIEYADTGLSTIGGDALKKPIKWWKQLRYNPRSSNQTIELLKSLNIKVPKKRDGAIDPETGEQGETADSKVLRKHMGKYPIFAQILAYRQMATMKSNFNWVLRPDGRVGTLYNFNPSTWRKGSSSVNLMNIPKREKLADAFRRTIVASPGCVLMEGDSSAIEAVLVGVCAGSKNIIRLAKAGIHGWVTAAWNKQPIPLDLPFEELQRRCKEAKYADEVSYERNKRVIHLSNYKGTAARVLEEYPDIFKTLKEATDLQQFYLSTEPGRDVLKWHEAVITRAAKDKFLVNHFNYKHYFYETMHFDRRTYSAWMKRGVEKQEAERKAWKLGDDAKRAIAFTPQSDASAIQTEILLRLVEYENVLDWLRLIIHDAIVLELPEAQADWMARILNTEMTRFVPEVGESIGCEIKYGYNLGKWHATDNPNGMKEVKFALAA